ncbi:MAG: DASS family sodium-coupled anion symporter [Candidatus Aminicenantes bacterium]|nr:DASS family sodium-coupled anion symporter [Candidatus Aminicenantes bacterium]MDH5742134.1 DASS family sodium-coupled anion symporter [Candidatus Aminicenantes bacterium]
MKISTEKASAPTRLKWLKQLFLFSGMILGLALILLPPPSGLSDAGIKCLGVATICVTLWIFAPIPLAVTSLAAIILLPALEILDKRLVFSFFGNSAVFFLLGVFIIAGAMMHTGLSKRIALFFLTRFDKSPQFLIFGILLASSILSLFMPEHAVAAMMFPVVMEIARSLRLEKGKSPLAVALFLALTWGAVIGGIGTFLGGARAPLAVELLKETFNRDISFTSWAIAATPIAVFLTFIAFLILSWHFKPEIKDITPARRLLQQELDRMDKISINEVKIGLLLLVTIFFWIYGGHRMGLAVISLAAAIMVFLLNIVEWVDIIDYVNWGVIIMYGGAIALGKALAETQAIEWLAEQILGTSVISPFLMILTLSALAKVLTELISNAAAVVILVPFSFGFVATHAVSPELLVLGVTIPAGLAFCLPVGTPPNAIAYSSGYFTIRSILKSTLLLSVISWAVFLLFVRFYWPLIM